MNENNENLVPFFHDTDDRYFDLRIPPPHKMNALAFLETMEFQLSLVPKMYRDNPDVWHIYDLEGYQRMIAGYIQWKVEERNNA